MVIADSGQTPNTSKVIDHILNVSAHDTLLYIGDLSCESLFGSQGFGI